MEELFENGRWKYLAAFVVAIIILMIGSCSFRRVQINAGEKGVIVAQPYFIGTGGVQTQALEPGGYWVWKSNQVFGIHTQPQQVDEKFDDMYSSDNIPVDFDAFLSYQITDPVSFYKNWGGDWYSANVQQVFRTSVREECKRHKMTDLTSNPETPAQIEKVALTEVQKFAKDKNIPFVFSRVNVGKINPNKDVMQEIAATAVQQQRQRTELDRKKAEDNRKMTEVARAAADNAYREAMKLAPEQYIRLEAVKAYSHAAEECAKNDKCTMILTQPGNDVKQTIGVK